MSKKMYNKHKRELGGAETKRKKFGFLRNKLILMSNKVISLVVISICLFVLHGCNNSVIQPEIEPVEVEVEELVTELSVEWQSPRLFEDFIFPTINDSDDNQYFGEKIICNQVGKVDNEEYQDWLFVLCERKIGGMGYVYKIPYRTIVNPNDFSDYRIIIVWDDFPQHTTKGLDDLIDTFLISDLTEYPEQIEVYGGVEKIVFDNPDRVMYAGYYGEEYDHKNNKVVFQENSEWGTLYKDNSDKGSGGLLYELKDGSYITYEVNYNPYLYFDDNLWLSIKPNSFIWLDGKENESNYFLNHVYHCSAGLKFVFIPDDILDANQLIKVGETKKGDDLFGFSNIDNVFFKYILDNYHNNLKELGKMDIGNAEEKQQQFIDELGVVFWKDPLGRWVKMTKKEYHIAC